MPHATSKCEKFSDFVLMHKGQLETCGIPEIYWKSLFHKLKNEVYDAGHYFMIQKVEEVEEDYYDYSDEDDVISDGVREDKIQDTNVTYAWQVVVVKENGIRKTDPDGVFLIDHAWTYRTEQARKQLMVLPSLRERMCNLMEVDTDGRILEDIVEEILGAMWKYNQTYKLANAELASGDACPIWYVMDEFGCRIQHSDDPSVKIVPFYFEPTQITFNVMWPITDLSEGDEVTRDYVIGVANTLDRKLRLLPWKPADMTHLSFDLQEPESDFFSKFNIQETLPDPTADPPVLPRDRNIRVFTDCYLVKNHLNDNRFEFVDEMDEADIIWTWETIRNFMAWSEGNQRCYLNQFPFEMFITIKNLLASMARRVTKKHIDHDTLDAKPDWLPITFNLASELPQFVSYFQQRQKRGLTNYWICKPWNLGLGLDLHITDNLAYILRLPDTGPKIASLYVDEPVLIERDNIGQVKFDLRFTVMLVSVKPLVLYVHQKFLIRYANIAYSLDHFDEYEKHFTVMTNRPEAETFEMRCEDFIDVFEKQYPGQKWNKLEDRIHGVIHQVFEAATSKPAPLGIGHSPISRAIYGIDIILKWKKDENGVRQVAPVLIECNFHPNNERFCKYYPTFMNDIFGVLFLNEAESHEVVRL